MPRFAAGHASATDWMQAAQQCLDQMGELPDKANLGFLYVTSPFDNELDVLLDFFKKHTGVEHWVGTVGIGICGTGKEYHEVAAVAAMVGALPEGSFRVFSGVDEELTAFTEQHASWCREHAPTVAMIHADPRNTQVPELIDGLAGAMDDGFLVGGLTSSQWDYPQIADTISRGGLSGVLFSNQVNLATALTQGCSPIGGKHVVTEAQRNIAIQIDGKPALDVFNEDIGEVLARDLTRIGGYIFAGFPIPGSDTGDYLVRNLVGIDTQQKLLAVGEILQPGEQIMFCRRDGNTAREDMQRMLHDLKRRITGKPAGGVYYTCLGRGRHLFGEHSEELQIIRDELGDFPLVGFYANGEISHNRLYGYTGVLTLFV